MKHNRDNKNKIDSVEHYLCYLYFKALEKKATDKNKDLHKKVDEMKKNNNSIVDAFK